MKPCKKIRQKLLIAAANVFFFFSFCEVASGCAFRVSDLADQTRQPPEISVVIYAAAARHKHLWKCDPSSALMHLMMIYAASRERKKKGEKNDKNGKRGNASSSPSSCDGCGNVVGEKISKNELNKRTTEVTKQMRPLLQIN